MTDVDRCVTWAREIGDALLDVPAAIPQLTSGDAGLALFYAYLAKATGDARYMDAAETRLGKAIEDAGNRDPFLWSGTTGIAWTSEHVCGPLLAPNEEDLNADTDAFVDAVLDSPALWQHRFELMYGLAGIGVYLLERPASDTRRALLGKLLGALERLAEPLAGGGFAWFSNTDSRFPDGVHNLGLAHGSPGVIGFLARILREGAHTPEERPRIERLLRGTVVELQRARLPAVTRSYYPSFGEQPTDTSRLGWCFGDLAIATTLLAAGRAIGEPAWIAEATELALHASARDARSAGVVDIGVCHGALGLAHMFERFHAHVPEPALAAASARWLDHGFELRAPGKGHAGIQSWNAVTHVWGDDIGLLGGAAGIGLVLLTRARVIAPAWDRVFLLS